MVDGGLGKWMDGVGRKGEELVGKGEEEDERL